MTIFQMTGSFQKIQILIAEFLMYVPLTDLKLQNIRNVPTCSLIALPGKPASALFTVAFALQVKLSKVLSITLQELCY